ncbi:WYL domain-containing protein [Martelella soudanensis]|uniref:WYL domain-containing protein n=1 Tax=unclassified Martelella TaxID=2629616 RepID=UPI0015DF0A4B|nr:MULTISPECIES: WYL domain-containing protein [unclassified Martelella]
MDNKKDLFFGWIEACLRYAGEFGAAEKMVYGEVFGLSEPTVSRHQSEFARVFEEQVGEAFVRDTNNRVIGGRLVLSEMAALPETPVFTRMPAIELWLRDNLGGSGYFEVEIGRRSPEAWLMRMVTRSIRSRKPLSITYHSRRSVGTRIVSPHAIVRIAGRMHIRAYDHSKNEHRDFVLSRITDATLSVEGTPFIGAEEDKNWNCFQTILIEDLSNGNDPTARLGIRSDFGLNAEGQRNMRVREPLVQYLIDNMNPGYSPPVRVSMVTRLQRENES